MSKDWLHELRAAVGSLGLRRAPQNRARTSDARRCSFEALEGRFLLAANVSGWRDAALGTGRNESLVIANGQADPAKTKLIANATNGGPILAVGDEFGSAIVSLGDLDGDGVNDLAVGAMEADDTGAVHVLFMNADGTVKSSQKIANNIGGGPSLNNSDNFGSALAALGDLDGDGVTELAVGAQYDNLFGGGGGAVYVLFLNADGTVKNNQKIASGIGGGPTLPRWAAFGSALAAIGDLDGDGVGDLAVGAFDEPHGAAYILFLNADGTVKNSQKIGDEIGGGPDLDRGSYFGCSVASLGDIDGDGVTDIAVGDIAASGQYGLGSDCGAVYIMRLKTDGTAKSWTRIASAENGAPPLNEDDLFGSSLASPGDLDGDGISDLIVGADGYGPGYGHGAVYVLMLRAEGTVKSRWRITESTNGGPALHDYDRFGSAVASLGDLDGDGVIDLAVGARGSDNNGGMDDPCGAVYMLFLRPMTADFGDAPDTGLGNGTANYSTTAADNGPSHIIVSGLQMGASVDGDTGALQNAAANADSADGMLPSDEDGLVNPVADLQLTVGTQPSVKVWVTNTTGANATLYGWIDYNRDGIFDNSTERAAVAVPNGTESEMVALSFPTVPRGHTGTTYARFRLSTDPAAAQSIGPAADGEVEDWRAEITAPSTGLVEAAKTKKVARNLNGVPSQNIYLGGDVAAIGDLDGNGVTELINSFGYTLFMNPDGTVKHTQAIVDQDEHSIGGDHVAALGDLDGDGVSDVAFAGFNGITIVNMKADGTAKRANTIPAAFKVVSLAGICDVDGDGVADLAAGVETEHGYGDDYSGAVFVVLLNADGSVKDDQMIGDEIGGGPQLSRGDAFGSAVTSLGDIDGDGISDLAVGALSDNTGVVGNESYGKGAVYVVLMNPDGTAKSTHKIAHETGGGPSLDDETYFGGSIASLGDLDGDGVTDIAVGARYDNTGGNGRGAIFIMNLNADGTAKRVQKIANQTGGGPTPKDWDQFGSSVTSLGDLDGDGITDIAVGSYGYDTNGSNDGAVYVLFLEPVTNPAGDYNQNGATDAADYILWRKMLSSHVPNNSGADGSGNGVIDAADYGVWQANFGNSNSTVASDTAVDAPTEPVVRQLTDVPESIARDIALDEGTVPPDLVQSNLAVPTFARSAKSQTARPKQLWRTFWTAVAPNQDSLLGLLTIGRDNARREPAHAIFESHSNAKDETQCTALIDSAIDLAFAAV
jgi:hypothetical protein